MCSQPSSSHQGCSGHTSAQPRSCFVQDVVHSEHFRVVTPIMDVTENQRPLANSSVAMRSSARSALRNARRQSSPCVRAMSWAKSSAPRMSAMSCAVTFRGLGLGAFGIAAVLPLPGALSKARIKTDSRKSPVSVVGPSGKWGRRLVRWCLCGSQRPDRVRL